MKARKKRKPDFRRIGPSQTYSVSGLAEAVQRDPATVRNWLRQGLPTIDGLKPTLIDGAQAKEWLRQKWAKRKASTASNEAHCLHCRKSRPFSDGSRAMKQMTAKVLVIIGTCAVCGSRMNKFASAKSVAFLDPGSERKGGRSAA
jgi:hypothetical protein